MHNFFTAVQMAHSNVRVANAYQNMNFVIHVLDARMAVMNHHTSAIRNVFQAYSKRYMHKHVQEVACIVHFNVEMGDAVRQRLFVQDETVAVITVTNKIAVCAVSNNIILTIRINLNEKMCTRCRF